MSSQPEADEPAMVAGRAGSDVDPAADSVAKSVVEPAVLAAFVANHRAFLSFLERRLGNRALAEDLLQDAFVRGMTHAGAVNEESITAWFYRTLRNAVIDHHRRDQSASKALARLAGETADATPDAELHAAVCQCVGQLADTLKQEYAHALKRIDLDGLAVKDYANEAGISPGNAAVRVFRAREALRKQLVRACGTCAEHGCADCSCASSACAPAHSS